MKKDNTIEHFGEDIALSSLVGFHDKAEQRQQIERGMLVKRGREFDTMLFVLS